MIHALKGEIYMPSTSMINDPFDLNPTVELPTVVEARKDLREVFGQNSTIRRSTVEEIEGRKLTRVEANLLKKKSKPGYSTTLREIWAFKEMAKTLPARSCIACFSERVSSPLMWAHYADNHMGICLKYRLEISKISISDHMAPIKVNYSETRPSVSFRDILEFTGRGRKRLTTKYQYRTLDKLMLNKGLDWQYEKEWRILIPADQGNRYCHSSHLKLHSIVLGLRTSESDAENVKNLVSGKISVIRVKPDGKSFEMVIT
jgi:hypothetical protein